MGDPDLGLILGLIWLWISYVAQAATDHQKISSRQ